MRVLAVRFCCTAPLATSVQVCWLGFLRSTVYVRLPAKATVPRFLTAPLTYHCPLLLTATFWAARSRAAPGAFGSTGCTGTFGTIGSPCWPGPPVSPGPLGVPDPPGPPLSPDPLG